MFLKDMLMYVSKMSVGKKIYSKLVNKNVDECHYDAQIDHVYWRKYNKTLVKIIAHQRHYDV